MGLFCLLWGSIGPNLSFIGHHWAYFVVYCLWVGFFVFYGDPIGPILSLCGLHGPILSFIVLYLAHFVFYWALIGLILSLWAFIGPILWVMGFNWAYFIDIWASAAYFVDYKPFIGPIFSFMSPSLGLFCHLWAIQWAYFVFIGSRVKGRKPEACFTFGANFWASFNIIGPTYGPILGPKLAIYCHISNILFTAQCDCSGPIELILFWSMWKRFS